MPSPSSPTGTRRSGWPNDLLQFRGGDPHGRAAEPGRVAAGPSTLGTRDRAGPAAVPALGTVLEDRWLTPRLPCLSPVPPPGWAVTWPASLPGPAGRSWPTD